MGCGKSTIGKILSHLLGLPFVDLDHHIEIKAGVSIPEIFAEGGEEMFRAVELECLEEVTSDGQDKVLALGGGAVTRETAEKIVHERTLCIYLKASVETLKSHLEGSTDRPMLKSNDMEALLRKREPIYERCAHIVIETDDKGAGEIAQEIREKLNYSSSASS